MSRSSRSTPRAGHGPGRETPRSRTVSRPGERAGRLKSAPPTVGHREPEDEVLDEPLAERVKFTQLVTGRAVALVVVFAVLVVSYASSLQTYIAQQREMAITKKQIEDSHRNISSLQDEVDRWNDPNYARSQARERLGWVVPGETGYRVIGPDGKLLGGARIESTSTLPAGEHPQAWFDRLTGSMRAADEPAPAATKPAVITPPSTRATKSKR